MLAVPRGVVFALFQRFSGCAHLIADCGPPGSTSNMQSELVGTDA